MSSNIEVQKICQYCGKEFTARKTTTATCSDPCAKKLYKLRLKESKIQAVNAETLAIKTKPIEELKAKEFLTIAQACQMLSISRWTIWRAIKNNEIKAGKIGRRVIIKRSELDRVLS